MSEATMVTDGHAVHTRTPLGAELLTRGVREAVELLEDEPDRVVADALADFYPDLALQILWRLPEAKRRAVFELLPAEKRQQWTLNVDYPEESVGRLMDPPLGVLRPEQTVAEAVAELRELAARAQVTYGYVLDPARRLLGVIVFRELLYAEPSQRLEQPRREPLRRGHARPSSTPRDVLRRHYPVYPVCEDDGRLAGSCAVRRSSSTRHSRSAPSPARWSASRRKNASRRRGNGACCRHPWL
jgi:magnesium transporter